MNRSWTGHWQFRYWRPDVNPEGEPIRMSGSNSFRKRGVSVGDAIYIVSLGRGQLFLGGRMIVEQIVSRDEAAQILGNDRLYDAEEWVICGRHGGTSLQLHRKLSPALTRQLRFVSTSGLRPPAFVSETDLDNQATRGIRELSSESAALLNRILMASDQIVPGSEAMTVTAQSLEKLPFGSGDGEFRLPEEASGQQFREGSRIRIEVNRYERDEKARLACIEAHGATCCICGLAFGTVYGPEAAGYIHVHHIEPLSDVGQEHSVDPVRDMRPVCPNCHAVLHLGGRSRTVEEVRELIATSRSRS